MLEEVLMGYNCTLFAYGQTGTGKTHTMEGSLDGTVPENENAGIIPRALNQLFSILESVSSDFSVRVSMLELYNEELNDLLGVDGLNSKLRLFEDAKGRGSVVIQGLEEVLVKNVKDVLTVLRKGAERRQTAGTLMNDKSRWDHYDIRGTFFELQLIFLISQSLALCLFHHRTHQRGNPGRRRPAQGRQTEPRRSCWFGKHWSFRRGE